VVSPPPTEPCTLRSTQPLKVSTRDFYWGKDGRCVWLTTYHPFSAETSRKSGALTYPEPLGPPRPVAGDLYFTLLTLYYQCAVYQVARWYCRTVCRLTADCSPLSTGILYGRLQRVTIPDAVIIQFVLLKMNIVLLETC